ncbi:TPA: phenylalanine--tRNA ligase subunit alpha [Candidatus Thalassarchaeaceae archaeon]|jgi:phenylalanyl-tRNA synthetase alpha chain|nr:MAG TPA: phenylalanine--tRNA ligase subunit alpha [Candidatus Poseidoniales archaeon]HII44348.1 phenylalanine--tRNA ligase subunit alpha [Candidatus Thalassarchaeaceae archaeon]|tara:strand:- start:3408 stop:4901 length:1494 start_codon:yes stop_codon:yes gene_type:complete
MSLGNNERRMLRAMLSDSSRTWNLAGLLEATGWSDQVHIAGAGTGLAEAGLLEISESITSTVSLGPEGEEAAKAGLLESRIWDWMQDAAAAERTMQGLFAAGFERHEAGPGVGLLKAMGVRVEAGALVCDDEESVATTIASRASFIQSLAESPKEAESLDSALVEHFASRKNLIATEDSTARTWTLTKAGAATDAATLEEVTQIGQLTPELLQGDSWRDAEFKSFDVNAPAPIPAGGRPHPMQALIGRIRSVFLEMGFSEIEGDYVQSAGWNMDALFIPQSHPARTMQDTFYLDEPASVEVAPEMLDLWARVHEHGHDTGSKGWGGSFDKTEAQKGLLRTHTTVNTIRHIAENPNQPCRVFGIGRVFRQETLDRTHLPEFHQIEGIIHEPDANLPMLISTLKTFYAKMGYPDVRVRPAYFPYTEPSVEVEVYWRGEWLELGGSGIFRPEVTEPLGTEWPVCAWGMGLERLAMLVLGLDDIRELYQPDLERLSKMPIL